MKSNAKLGVIILAAGSSSRLGYPKQLVEFRGRSLLQHSLDAAGLKEFGTKLLVLGAGAPEIQKNINNRDFEVVINEKWTDGIGTSISKGISEALKIEKDLDHILIMLSDQPFVTKKKIHELILMHLDTNKCATFSEYEGDVGVPAIFSREIFPNLKKLKSDQGAKKLLHNKNFEFQTLKFEKGNFDVDTPEDVDLLRQLEKKCK